MALISKQLTYLLSMLLKFQRESALEIYVYPNCFDAIIHSFYLITSTLGAGWLQSNRNS